MHLAVTTRSRTELNLEILVVAATMAASSQVISFGVRNQLNGNPTNLNFVKCSQALRSCL